MPTYVGQSLRRKEDLRLLTGQGRFVGDVRVAGMVEAAVLRSTRAHARIRRLDVARARALPGVLAVFTAREVEGKIKPQFRLFWEETLEEQRKAFGPRIKRFRRPALARDAVYRVGEPLAVVVAPDRYLAEDALDLIEVEYEPLPVLADPERALHAEAPVIGPELQAPALGEGLPANAQADFCIQAGEPDRAFREAHGTFTARYRLPRQVGSPIETRGVVAVWEADRRQLSVWATTQLPHMLRASLGNLLDLPQEAIQIIGTDMGGSFGGGIWNEDILIPFIAMHLGRPVRWIEDRAENLVNARHSRDQAHTVEVAYTKDGRVTGLRDRIVLDVGVYSSSPLTCFYNTATHLRGQYRVENFRVEAIAVLTNKTANTPVRGAGRQEAAFVMDRVLEGVALRLGLDPAEVRRRNLIPAEAIPFDMGIYYRDGKRIVYDSGDFPAQLSQALALAGYEQLRARQAAWRAQGRRLGIGISCYVEGTGAGPHEGAVVRLDPSGQVFVYAGCKNHGQGLETTLAQVCADVLGVDPAAVSVRTGDTRSVPFGGGTAASRSAVTAGMAVAGAARRLREKVLAAARDLLAADGADLEMAGGRVFPRGAPERGLTLGQVAQAAMPGAKSAPPGEIVPPLEAQYYYVPPAVTFASGTHVAVVEVDEETGRVDLLRYVVAHDCGKALNPTIVEGQVHGGVAHGIGNALFEEVLYDAEGQPLTGSYLDYLLPTAADVPPVEVGHQECLSTLNPLGVKGCGEGGVASPPGAIANAILDALRPLAIDITEIPVTPERLVRLIQEAKGRPLSAEGGSSPATRPGTATGHVPGTQDGRR